MNKIPWWSPQTNGKLEKELILNVLKSNFPNDGEITTRLENKIAKLLKVKHTIAVTSGTSALYLSLKAFNIGPGDEVIIPDMTFIATANAVSMCNAKPVLVDVDPETTCLSPEAFEKAITKKTKAVIPVHFSGRCGSINQIVQIAKKEGLIVIEDAAQALGSKRGNKYLGTFGKTGCFSLSPAKTVTCGQGGIIATNDTAIHNRIRELKDQGRPVRGTGGNDIHISVGYNFKLTNLQAALAVAQLSYLRARTRRMIRNNLLYQRYLAEIKEVKLFRFNPGEIPQWTDCIANQRDSLCEYLNQKGIGTRKYYLPIHTQKPYKQSGNHFVNSTFSSKNAMWLPSAFTLTDTDLQKTCHTIKTFYSKK